MRAKHEILPKLKKTVATKEETCPVCGEKLLDWTSGADNGEVSVEDTVAVMTAFGLL